MRFGDQTVTFVTVTAGTEGRFEREKARTRTDVTGCRFRPLPGSESVAETDVITRPWKLTAPPEDAAWNADATGELEYNGDSWQITGVEPFTDMAGRPFKVTVIAERYIG